MDKYCTGSASYSSNSDFHALSKAFAKAITADSCFKKNPSTGRLLGLTPAAIAELSGGAARARLAAKEA